MSSSSEENDISGSNSILIFTPTVDMIKLISFVISLQHGDQYVLQIVGKSEHVESHEQIISGFYLPFVRSDGEEIQSRFR